MLAKKIKIASNQVPVPRHVLNTRHDKPPRRTTSWSHLWRRSSRRLCRRGACLPFLAKWPKGRERVWTGDGPEVVSFFWPHLPVGHPFLEVDICTGAQTNLWRQVHGPLPTAVKQVPDEYRPTILMAVFGNLSTAVWNISDLLVIAFLLPSLSSWQER